MIAKNTDHGFRQYNVIRMNWHNQNIFMSLSASTNRFQITLKAASCQLVTLQKYIKTIINGTPRADSVR